MKVCPKCFKQVEDANLSRCPEDNRELLPLEGDDRALGEVLAGRFLLTGFLGRGAMGAVYKAYQISMRRYVAVKVLLPHIATSDQHVQRFIREATSAAQLKSPHTVTLYDFGETDDGRLFIAMEMLGGKELADILTTKVRFTVDEALDIISQACLSLEEAHERQIIHRDLKPANMMVESRPDNPYFVKIVDFGIAKLLDEGATMVTQDGSTCGTPSYMAPEQVMGRDLDARTDIYALGVVLFELVTGKRPFMDTAATAILLKHLQEPIPSVLEAYPELHIPERVDGIIQRCVAKRPEERYNSCIELRNACVAALGIAPAAPATEAYREAKVPQETAQSFSISDDETVIQPALGAQSEGTEAFADTMADASPVQMEETPYDQTEAMAPPPTLATRQLATPGTPRWLWPAAGGLVVLLLLAAGLFMMSASKSDDAPTVANKTQAPAAADVGAAKQAPATPTETTPIQPPERARVTETSASQGDAISAPVPADVVAPPSQPDIVTPAADLSTARELVATAETSATAPAADATSAPADLTQASPVDAGASQNEAQPGGTQATAEKKAAEKQPPEKKVEEKKVAGDESPKKIEKKVEKKSVSTSGLKVTGDVDAAAAKKSISGARRGLQKCRDKSGWSSDQLSVTVMFGPNGKAKSVKVAPEGEAASCVKDALSGVTYPTFEGNFSILRFKVTR